MSRVPGSLCEVKFWPWSSIPHPSGWPQQPTSSAQDPKTADPGGEGWQRELLGAAAPAAPLSAAAPQAAVGQRKKRPNQKTNHANTPKPVKATLLTKLHLNSSSLCRTYQYSTNGASAQFLTSRNLFGSSHTHTTHQDTAFKASQTSISS